MRIYQPALLQQLWRILLLGIFWLALGLLVVRQPILGLLLMVLVIVTLLGVILFFGWDGVLSLKRAVPVLLVVAILFPYIRLPGETPDVRLEFVIAIVAWGLLFLGHLATGFPIRLRRCPVYKWFGLFGFSIVLSMAYAAWFKGQLLIGRDFWELVKVFLYFLLFALVMNQKISLVDLRYYYKLALLIFVVSSCVGFLQYIDFLGINERVSPYYAPTQMRGLLVHGRITGTMPNPNEFGALMVLALSIALSGILFFQERKLQFLCWGTLPVFGLALVLTLSRSALVSLFLAWATILFLFFQARRFKVLEGLKYKLRRLLTVVLLGCFLGALMLQIMPEKAFYRYGQLVEFTKATSWQKRVAMWKENFAIWLESPWLGWGPGKAIMGTIVDNEWLLLLRRYGVVGLVIFLCLFGNLFFSLSRIRKAYSDPSVVALSVALQGTFVGYACYMALAAVYHSLQLMPIVLLFLGLAYSQWQPRWSRRALQP